MNKKKNILLVGGGDFTRKVIKLLAQFDEYNIIGYTDIENKGSLFDVEFLGQDKIASKLIQMYPGLGVIVCIVGNLILLKKKNDLINKYSSLGATFPSIVSKNAYVDTDSIIGKGVIIFDNAHIDFESDISDFCVINLDTLIGHHVKVGRNTIISPKSIIGGRTVLGENCFIGMNSTLNASINITHNVVIGAGTNVYKNIDVPGTYVSTNKLIRL